MIFHRETWIVYAWRRGEQGLREWAPIAWADDLALAQNLFLQACATTNGRLRFIHDSGEAHDDPGFDRTVLAERSAR